MAIIIWATSISNPRCRVRSQLPRSEKPGIYYNRVNDYIQGTSTGIIIDSKPVLQYQNINAELYGFDGNLTYQLNQNIGLGGILSYVRGKNTDNGDNLYRIAPLTARLYADYQTGT
jgi:iron complex outermembrane receptor protein